MLGPAVQALYVFSEKDRDWILVKLRLFQAKLSEFVGAESECLPIGFIKSFLQVLSKT